MNPTFLQIFLLVNVFLIGVIATVAVRHIFAHFRPQPHEVEKRRPAAHAQIVHLPPEIRERLLEVSQSNFQAVLDNSAAELQNDLKFTASQLNSRLEKLGTEIVGNEMRRYRQTLDELRQQAEATIGGAQTETAKHQADLKAKLEAHYADLEAQFDAHQTELVAKMNQEIASEKQRLTEQINTKLSDAISSFLIETMQHNVDLGAQAAYMTSILEEHKDEIIKGIKDES